MGTQDGRRRGILIEDLDTGEQFVPRKDVASWRIKKRPAQAYSSMICLSTFALIIAAKAEGFFLASMTLEPEGDTTTDIVHN